MAFPGQLLMITQGVHSSGRGSHAEHPRRGTPCREAAGPQAPALACLLVLLHHEMQV